MVILLTIFTATFVFLGSLPKRIADKHHHPQAVAIDAVSWLAVFLAGWVGRLLVPGRSPNLAAPAIKRRPIQKRPPTAPRLTAMTQVQAGIHKPHTLSKHWVDTNK